MPIPIRPCGSLGLGRCAVSRAQKRSSAPGLGRCAVSPAQRSSEFQSSGCRSEGGSKGASECTRGKILTQRNAILPPAQTTTCAWNEWGSPLSQPGPFPLQALFPLTPSSCFRQTKFKCKLPGKPKNVRRINHPITNRVHPSPVNHYFPCEKQTRLLPTAGQRGH